MARPIAMLEVSLVSSWSKDLPRMEAPGFLELVWPEIRKNVFEVSTSSDQKRQLETFKKTFRSISSSIFEMAASGNFLNGGSI